MLKYSKIAACTAIEFRSEKGMTSANDLSNTEFEIIFQDETAPGVAIPESGEGKVRGWQKEPLSIMWCLNAFVAESSSQSRLIYASTGFPDLLLYFLIQLGKSKLS